MNRIWTIARRELKAQFDQPAGYVLLVVFLAINAFLFFRNALLANTASMRPMMDLLPWLFLFFVPAMAMRSLAEDNRGGLLEIVLAQPISEAELIAGKYLGVLLALLLALGATLLIPIGLELGSDLPWGPVIAQFLGAALLAAGLSGVGVWASSLSRSQITAFIIGVAVMFALILVGLDPVLVGLPPAVGTLAARLGVLTHFDSIGRGVIDLRDVLYFLSLAAVFLVLAYAQLMSRRLGSQSPARRQLRLGTLLLVAILVVANLAGGQLGGRLDLSPGQAYTLAPASRAIARSPDDIVTIRLFASRELPSEFALTRRDVTDLLRDLRSAGKGKIRIVERDPAADPATADEARRLGVVPVQFNVVGRSELQVKEGYFGLVIQYADRHETIPFVQRTDDLEYRLVSAIRSLTRTTRPAIALVSDPQAGIAGSLRQELEKSYRVMSPSLSDSTPLDPDLKVMVLALARDSLATAERDKLRRYLEAGGKLLVLESGMAISPQAPFASGRPIAANALLEPYGVSIAGDLVYDLRANQVIAVPTMFGRLLRPYPYFVRAQSTRLSPVNAELAELGLPWTSSIDTSKAPAGTITPLFVTSGAAGIASGFASIDPNQTFATSDLTQRLLAVQIAPKNSRARLIVVGNGMLVSDDMIQRSPENQLFALNAVDWLAQDDALMAIRAKNRRPPPLVFSSEAVRQAVKYVNLIGLPLAIALIGFAHLIRRRRRALVPYRPQEVPAS
jgi:ABC-type uncharacterized transport system involved in gliding motility auxiliary subunit